MRTKKVATEITDKPKRRPGRPRKVKSIEQFADDIEIDRMTELEQEAFYRHADQHEIERYVNGPKRARYDDDQDSFSYWFGQN